MFIVDEKVAENVRYIFQLLLEGHSLMKQQNS